MARMAPKAAAELLTEYFLEAGNFIDGGSLGTQAIAAMTTPRLPFDENGFSGLAVESVGYTVSGDFDEDLADEDKLGVHVYVAKGSKKFLNSLPAEIHGTPCTYHNIGRLAVKPQLSNTATHRGHIFERNGRAACGSSCHPTGRMYTGTFGALVRKSGSGTIYGLSNNHVFADCNHMPVGQPIMVPSAHDSGPGLRAPTQVCTHSEIIELRSGVPPLVSPCREDLAIAEVPDPSMVSSWQGDATNGYDTPTSAAILSTGLPVKKWGRTTGLTSGILQSAQSRSSVPYDGEKFKALVWFRDVWTIRSIDENPFALPGDSGSLVVTEDGKHAVGILFATSQKGAVGIIVPIDRVLQAFGRITLVNKHGL